MGLHICVVNKNSGDDHPEWDYIRQWYDSGKGHNKGFDDLIMDVKCVTIKHDYCETGLFRPDISALREKIDATNWEQEAKDRYYNFCDLLERDNNYGVYLSY